MGPFQTIVHLYTLPQAAELVLTTLQALAVPTRNEPNCLEYQILSDPEDTTHIVLLEQWVDDAALEAHFASQHFKLAADRMRGSLRQPFEMTKYIVRKV